MQYATRITERTDDRIVLVRWTNKEDLIANCIHTPVENPVGPENNKKVEEFYDWSSVQSAIDDTVRLKEVCNNFDTWADGIITDMKNRHGG